MILEDVQFINVPIRWVDKGEKRLDASFYAQDVIKARLLLERISMKIKIEKLIDLADDIFMPALKTSIPFHDNGEDYLTQSEVELFLPKARKKVNVNKIKNVDRWKVKSGYLLISQSGTIGRITIATRYLEQFVISPNPIRVVITNEKLRGYIYTFLSSWIGQALIKSPQYGITVKHILPHHLYNIPIPRIPDLEEEISKKILESHKLREEAQDLLLKAEQMIYSELGLPKIDEDDVEYFDGEVGKLAKAFGVKASELDYRLDASYHVPLVKVVLKELTNVDVDIKKIEDITERIFIPPRMKRPYVNNISEGIPFLLPGQAEFIKFFDVKYVWKKMRNKHLYRLEEGDILISRSGTLGRILLVTKYLESWIGSDDFIYLKLKQEINPGYVIAFFNTLYGKTQLLRETYGGVINHLEEGHLKNVQIPLPSKPVQDKIGSLVIEAYNKKDKANQIEEEAIKKLENTLMKIAES